MKYKITDLLSIGVDEQGKLQKNEAACLLAILAGLKHDIEASQGPANVFVGEDGAHYWIPKSVKAGEEADFTDYADMKQWNVFTNPAIAQSLATNMGMVIQPITFVDGNLAGLWEVMYSTGYGGMDYSTGWKFGAHEPVKERSPNLIEAINRVAMRIAGLTRKAYIYAKEDSPALVYLSDWNLDFINQNTTDGDKLTPIPALDIYAISGISDEEAKEAITAALSSTDDTTGNEQPAPAPATESDATKAPIAEPVAVESAAGQEAPKEEVSPLVAAE